MRRKKEDSLARRPDRIEITLLQDHTHAGRDCRSGDKIIVRTRQAENLRAAGVIK